MSYDRQVRRRALSARGSAELYFGLWTVVAVPQRAYNA